MLEKTQGFFLSIRWYNVTNTYRQGALEVRAENGPLEPDPDHAGGGISLSNQTSSEAEDVFIFLASPSPFGRGLGGRAFSPNVDRPVL